MGMSRATAKRRFRASISRSMKGSGRGVGCPLHLAAHLAGDHRSLAEAHLEEVLVLAATFPQPVRVANHRVQGSG